MNGLDQVERPERAIDDLLHELQGEPLADMVERERFAFDRIAGPFTESLVLAGAGALGRFTLAGLRRAGVEPVAFADNNRRLWGTSVDGLRVFSPSDAAVRFARNSSFVVTIYHGASVRAQLRELSCPRVAPFAPLFWKYSDVFIPSSCLELPHRILQRSGDIQKAYSVLSDDCSRSEFCSQLRWRVLLDYACLPRHDDEGGIYFPADLVRPLADEVFVDCGAFDGDSVRRFLSRRNSQFRQIWAIEPDPANRASLARYVSGLSISLSDRINVLPYAVGDSNGAVSFEATSSAASRVKPVGSASTVESRRLDDLFPNGDPTYIKMDIEGAEPDAIRGASEILASGSAVLAACIYHRSEHLWQIPLLIHSISPEHRIFLRRYAEECWEMVCYAVPTERLV